jgi:XTP/dITP diphosphohydrolase
MQLLIATQNKGKLREYRRLLADTPFEIVGLDEVGLGSLDVEETGSTFAQNALIKAKAYAEAAQKLTLADDSGLVVDALDGRPGVYSARYGPPGLDVPGQRAHLLDEMNDVPAEERSARFVCVIAVYHPATQQSETVRGTVEGQILFEDHDDGYGFGYDPIFQPEGYDQSFGQIAPDEKNRISHRAKAAAKLPPLLSALTAVDE